MNAAAVLLRPAISLLMLYLHVVAPGCDFVLISICVRFTTRDAICTLYVMYLSAASTRHSGHRLLLSFATLHLEAKYTLRRGICQNRLSLRGQAPPVSLSEHNFPTSLYKDDGGKPRPIIAIGIM